jgi:two-component system NarL family response regulator
MNGLIRILLVEDHSIVRQGLAALLDRQPELEVVGQAASGEQGLGAFRRLAPDVTLMDLKLPGISGVEAITRIRAESPGARIVVLTTYDGDEDIYRALEAGARGYILKTMSCEELVEAIRTVHAGGRRIPPEVAVRLADRVQASALTEREREVIGLIVRGRSNHEIARALALTVGTVKGYVHNIFSKLGVADRVQAVSAALRRGIARLDPGSKPPPERPGER